MPLRTKMSSRVRLILAAALALAACGPAAAQDGQTMFEQNCSACHQTTGKGVPGAFPSLAGDPFVVGAPQPVVSTVLKGRGGMPTFGDQLTDAQLASILTYVRGAWGNHAAPIDAAFVAKVRGGGASPAGAGAAQQAH